MILTIKSIIRWEQLRHKPFARLNYSDVDDIASIFYTCSLDENSEISYEEFKNNLTEGEADKLMSEFDKHTKILSQFQNKPPKTEKSEKKSEEKETEDNEPLFIKQIVATLIMAGLDANYALNEMNLCDLPVYLEAYESIKKERLEQERLWTYINISPYLSDKTSSPKDLYPFPWEKKEAETENLEQAEKGMTIFEEFMKKGRNFID